MAMSQTELENQLKALVLYSTEVAAVQAWADAFAAFFEGDGVTHGAESAGVYILPAGVALGKAAMLAALSGMSASGQGAAKIAAGISAFWTALMGTPASCWPAVTTITPPTALAGLATALQGTFNTNKNTAASKDVAMTMIAADIYGACQGGEATWPGPTQEAIT